MSTAASTFLLSSETQHKLKDLDDEVGYTPGLGNAPRRCPFARSPLLLRFPDCKLYGGH